MRASHPPNSPEPPGRSESPEALRTTDLRNGGTPSQPAGATPYCRVDWRALEETPPAAAATREGEAGADAAPIRWFIPPLAAILSLGQSCFWVYASNVRMTAVGGSLIPIVGFALLMGAVLLVNPLARMLSRTGATESRGDGEHGADARPLHEQDIAVAKNLPQAALRFRPFRGGRSFRGFWGFSRPELMTLFAALFVTTGLSTYGLVDQLVPLIAAPFDPSWNVPQRGWDANLIPHLNRDLYITDPELIREYRRGLGPGPKPSEGWTAQAAFLWRVACHVPWRAWAAPLGCWMIFIAGCYALFYSLTYVVLPLWADREKLIFPLARLPESLLPESTDRPGTVPRLFLGVGFWGGFAVSFLVLGWNGLVQSGRLPGLSPISLGMSSWTAIAVFKGSFLEGMDYALAFLVIFTAIGLAFLLPQEMTFSVWFYYLASRMILLVMVRAGYVKNALDIRGDFLWGSDLISSQGGGGLMIFAAISLARCLLEFKRLAAGRPWREQIRIATPVLGLGASMAVLSLWLWWNHLGLGWSMLLVLVMTLLTLGLMRIVAEAGIYWFQSYTGPFHLYRMFGLGRVLAPALTAPILPIYSVLFLDLKCFLAPSLLCAAKMRQDVGGSRRRFHLAMVGSIVVSVVGSIVFVLIHTYSRGADVMFPWFYSIAPQRIFDTASRVAGTPPALDTTNALWFLFGGAWTALSCHLRRTIFWFPHPVGYMALISPLMEQLWMSFFIAWLIKRPVIRFGGKVTYEKARTVAIGLIMGELMAVLMWTVLALWTGIPFGNISLNRYGP